MAAMFRNAVCAINAVQHSPVALGCPRITRSGISYCSEKDDNKRVYQNPMLLNFDKLGNL
ncbi:hypothetical protein J6590_084824 [Homalodisca vitripennis]|nr:hypothetical protein J6590_084824 [Homalodisca vitripennis]